MLEPSRPTPALLGELVARHGVTLFFGTPSSYGPLIAAAGGTVEPAAFATVRRGVSVGEALPARMVHGMREQYGVEVLDGIGFDRATAHLPVEPAWRRRGGHQWGTGPRVRSRDPRQRRSCGAHGEAGTLYTRGDSTSTGYWCRTATNRLVFEGEWMRTGDTYVRNPDGTYTCLGRTDDVLKVGGIWVTLAEVEERLVEHPSVAEVVVAVPNDDGLDLPVACVVPADGAEIDPDALVGWCREGLASFKRPRAVLSIEEVPRTATGKVQRFRLRELAAEQVAAEQVAAVGMPGEEQRAGLGEPSVSRGHRPAGRPAAAELDRAGRARRMMDPWTRVIVARTRTARGRTSWGRSSG